MPFITREDGEHFVVPSQRDIITTKSNSQLKRELELRSENYGEYITLQKKNATQYEVAFSPDPGYLLGESIWHHFNRPADMIYCEAIPNTSEVILVIVKGGSVYLDGSFPSDSVFEELVVFLTQQNNFEIYIYGDVPISKTPEEGKLSFEDSNVKSFTVLEQPVFPTLPLLKIYQLQLLSVVLEEHGIGVLPIKKIAIGLVLIGMGYFIYSEFIATPETPATIAQADFRKKKKTQPVADPFQTYYDTLSSPAPDEEIKEFMSLYRLFLTAPGWIPTEVSYTNKVGRAKYQTKGAEVNQLLTWAKANNLKVQIDSSGIVVEKNAFLPNRKRPTTFADFNEVLAKLIDRMHLILPGNVLKISKTLVKGKTKSAAASIDLLNTSPMVISLVGEQLSGLPIKILKMSVSIDDENTKGSISIQVVGS